MNGVSKTLTLVNKSFFYLTLVNTFFTLSFLLIRSKFPYNWIQIDKVLQNNGELFTLFTALASVLYLFAFKYTFKQDNRVYYLILIALIIASLQIIPLLITIPLLIAMSKSDIIKYFQSTKSNE